MGAEGENNGNELDVGADRASSRIVFDLERDDYDAFQRHFLNTSPFVVRTIRKWQAILALGSVLPTAIGVYLYVQQGGLDAGWFPPFAIAYGLGYGIYLLTYFPTRYRRRWLRHIRRFAEIHPIDNHFGRATWTIQDGALETDSPLGHSRREINALLDVILTDEHAFIYTSGQTALILPRDRIVEGNFHTFMASIERLRK